MKRTEMIDKMVQAIESYRECYKDSPQHLGLNNEMEYLLLRMEKAGIRPPFVSEEDSNALNDVYIYANFNQWDEELIKDEKFQKAKTRRAERKKK